MHFLSILLADICCSLPYKLREESLKLSSKSFIDQTLDSFITKFRNERIMWCVMDFPVSAD